MSSEIQNNDALMNAFVHSGEAPIIVMAEDLPLEGGGIDYKKHFWEPQVGKSYTIKFLTNPGGAALTHRKIYKKLPDPKRKGKSFQVVSSGSAKTCDVLDLFFKLNNLKKKDDALAIQKLEKYLGVTNQACALIQVISSPDVEEIGIYRMFTFSTFGPNPTIANLVNKKLNPTKEAIDNGFEKEDIFNVFESAVMLLQCEESDYDGQKGREYGKSDWAPKKRGAFVNLVDAEGEPTGKRYEFTKEDIVDGKIRPEAMEAFNILIKELTNPDLSIHNFFAYKAIGDSKNSEETEKYLIQVNEKVKEIVPIIENARSITEIENYGEAEKPADSAKMIGDAKASDILKESKPSELANSILNNDNDANPEAPAAEEIASMAANSNPDVDDILNS